MPQPPRHRRTRLVGLFSLLFVTLLTASTAAFFVARARGGNSGAWAPSYIVRVSGQASDIGMSAPDIRWRDGATGKTRRLSDLRGKPVVLFLGSFTCPPFRISAGLIRSIAERYGSEVHCFLVYSKEAHPEYGDRDFLKTPGTLTDREKAAKLLAEQTALPMPVLIDPPDNPTERAEGSVPSRIIVIDAHGKIAFLSGYPSSDMAVPVPGVLDRLLGRPMQAGRRDHPAQM